MKTIFKASLLLLAISTLFVSCKKEDPMAHLKLTLKANGTDLVYGTKYTVDGKAVTFSLAQFYISGLSLADDEGTKQEFSSLYLIGKPGMAEVDLGTLTLDHIHTVDFRVGIDSVTNHADPTTYAAGNALAAQTPSMHWNWSSGYIFVKLEGQVDNDGDGTPETGFLYHIGMDSYAKMISVTYHSDFSPKDDMVSVCVDADITKFLTGLDFSTDLMTHTMDNMPLATKVSNNTASVFSKGCQ